MVWHAHMFFFLSHVGRGSPWRSRCTRNAIRKPCATWNCWGYGTVIRHHMHHWRLCDLQSRIQNPAILPWTGYGHWQWRSHHSMVASWNEQRSEFESWQKKGNFGFVRRMASLWRVSSRWTGTFAPLGRQVFKDPSLGIPFGIWSLLAICHIGPDHGSGHCWLDRVQTLQHQKRCHVPRPSTHANGGLNMSALGHAMLQAFMPCLFPCSSLSLWHSLKHVFSRFVMPNLTCQATTCFMSVMCVMKMLACQVFWHKFMWCKTWHRIHAITCFMSVMCVMKMLACQVLWHKFMLCPTQEMPKHKNDDEWAFQKKVKQVVKEILAEDESKNVSLQYVRTVVKEKLLKGDEPENLLKFNALVDSTVSHYQRKDREAASSSKPKHVVKPILKKWKNELTGWTCFAHVMDMFSHETVT